MNYIGKGSSVMDSRSLAELLDRAADIRRDLTILKAQLDKDSPAHKEAVEGLLSVGFMVEALRAQLLNPAATG